MADETTPHLGLVKPEVNGEQTENVWGFDLNDNFDKIDLRLSVLPESDAPLDGDIYGRRSGAWSRTVAAVDFETLQADFDSHTHTTADITDFVEATDDRVAALIKAGPNVTLTYDDVAATLTISAAGGSGGGGALSNGDYGDITVTNGGVTWTIDPGVVTYAKMQNVAANRLLGAVGAGSVQEITCTAAGRALLDDTDAATQRTTLGLGTAATAAATSFQPVDPTLTALLASTDDGVPGLLGQAGPDSFGKRPIGAETQFSILDRYAGDGRYAQFDSPVFTGNPRAPNPTPGDDDTSIATTHFVTVALSGFVGGDSPLFTGDPRAPTPPLSDNDTSIATTAFVKGQNYAQLNTQVSFSASPFAGYFVNPTSNATGLNGEVCAVFSATGEPSIGLQRTSAAPMAIKLGLSIADEFTIGGWSWPANRLTLTSTGNLAIAGSLKTPGFVTVGATNDHFIGTNDANTEIHSYGLGHYWLYYKTTKELSWTNASGAVFQIKGNGSTYVNSGRLVSQLNSQPAIVCYSPSQARGAAMYLGTDDTVSFGAGDVNGNALSRTIWFSSISNNFVIAGQAYKPGGGSWVDTSDARIKNVLGDYANGLDAVLALQPKRYSYKGNDTSTADGDSPHAGVVGTEYIGLIAQEAETVLPELVTQHEGFIDGTAVTDLRMLDTTPLIFALINSIKTLNTRLEVLEQALARAQRR